MSQSVINDSTLTAIADAINAKAGTTGKMLPSAMPEKIAAIPTGGRRYCDEFTPPEGMPDVREILEKNEAAKAYAQKAIFLFDRGVVSSTILKAPYITSDNPETVVTSGTSHTWADPYKYNWIIEVSNVDFSPTVAQSNNVVWVHHIGVKLPKANYSSLWMYGGTLLAFTGDIDTSEATMLSQMFFGCYNLMAVPRRLDTRNCTSINNLYRECFALDLIQEELDFSSATFSQNAFPNFITKFPKLLNVKNTSLYAALNQFYCAIDMPEVMNFTNATSSAYFTQKAGGFRYMTDILDLRNVGTANDVENLFSSYYLLRRLPSHMSFPDKEFSFNWNIAGATGLDYKSFAVFDENDNLTGGFVANLNDVTTHAATYTRTITLPRNLREKYTPSQRAVIVDSANRKGYTLGNFAV